MEQVDSITNLIRVLRRTDYEQELKKEVISLACKLPSHIRKTYINNVIGTIEFQNRIYQSLENLLGLKQPKNIL